RVLADVAESGGRGFADGERLVALEQIDELGDGGGGTRSDVAEDENDVASKMEGHAIAAAVLLGQLEPEGFDEGVDRIGGQGLPAGLVAFLERPDGLAPRIVAAGGDRLRELFHSILLEHVLCPTKIGDR